MDNQKIKQVISFKKNLRIKTIPSSDHIPSDAPSFFVRSTHGDSEQVIILPDESYSSSTVPAPPNTYIISVPTKDLPPYMIKNMTQEKAAKRKKQKKSKRKAKK